MDRLAELQTFVAIMDSGSLAAAARRLGRSPPSVTRVLAELEHRVGAVLLERTTRRLQPTLAGRRLADQARQILITYEDALAEAGGEVTSPKGDIRMTAPVQFGRLHVAPLLTAFLDAHPAINIDLQLADRVADLVEEDFDLALRIGKLTDLQLIARPVGEVRRLAVASPDYLARRGRPMTPSELAGHEVVQLSSRGAEAPWVFRGGLGEPLVQAVTPRFTVNQAEIAIAVARDGRGIVRALSYQLDDDLRAGRLVRILEDFEPEALPVSLAWPDSRRAWRRMRLLLDYLGQGLGALDVLRRGARLAGAPQS